MSQSQAVEKWRKSQFWKAFEPFRANDIASFCELDTRAAWEVVNALKEEVHKYTRKSHCGKDVLEYVRVNTGSKWIRTQWRNPLPDIDGKFTPRYY